MHLIPITEIHVAPDRQRRDFPNDQLIELAESIQWGPVGLQHPVVVRTAPDGYYIVSGERRLRAISDIYELGGRFSYSSELVPEGLIPATLLGELSELEAFEAELDENIRRADLTWQEQAAATAALAKLRGMQAAQRGEAPPTTAEIAEEVYDSCAPRQQDTTRKEVIVAKHLESNEAVKKAKTLDEAFKILKREERKEKQEQAAAEFGKTFTTSQHKVFQEDSLVWMANQPANQFSVILTDPPYGMGADEFGDSGGATAGAHAYKDDAATLTEILEVLSVESFRLAKEEAHLYCFCDIGRFELLKAYFEDAGWKVFRTPLIWVKPGAFRAPWPEQGPQRQYETILYAVKGNRKVNYLASDVLTYTPDTNLGHNAQKPVDLFTDLLKRSVTPGDKVLDPFCGSGTIFPAATAAKVLAVGVERDSYAYGIAAGRLVEE